MSGKLTKRSALLLVSALLALLPLAGTASASTAPLEVRAMNIAHTKIGDWYSYGAAGPYQFDCSGLVYYSYRHAGDYNISRTAQSQYNQSQKISYNNRRVGDLVFYGYGSRDIYHVGIYIGVHWYQGAWRSLMIAAPYTGARVRIEPVYGSWWNGTDIYFGRIN
jgi:cell wall-associated NlpC family hydrolase